MSDMWSCSSSSPIMHHSLPSPGNHGNHHTKVSSSHLSPHATVCSPHDLHQADESFNHFTPSHLPSPLHLPHAKLSSPLLPQSPQVTSPHLAHPHTSSPHLLPQSPQVTSPLHLLHPKVSSPLLLQSPQVTSPHLAHPHTSSSHLLPQSPQVTSPHLFSSPQQNHFIQQNHDPCWSRPDPPADVSYLPQSFSFQNPTSAHLDLQNQNQLSSVFPQHREELQNTHLLPCNTHTLMHRQTVTPGPAPDTWGPPCSTLPQLQGSLLGSMSANAPLGGWNSMEFSSTPEDLTQFFSSSYHDYSAPQPFCSPNTPGLSPHYPQTPTISSPGPQGHLREERPDLQTSRHLSRDKTFLLPECESFPVTSDLHQSSQHLLQSCSELIQNQNQNQIVLLSPSRSSERCFPPQKGGQGGSDAAQPEGLPAGKSWREERGRGAGGGGAGRGGGKRGRGGGGSDWMKASKSPDSRLLCTLCQRDFRSLPALNGHMRSHSGSRSSSSSTKVDASSPQENPSVSMVMPVSVPVQSGGSVKSCKSVQRTCSRLPPARGGAVLYRSLMHRGEAEEEEKEEEEGGAVDGGGHYTPPPMLPPLRVGTGLFCSVTSRRQQRVQTLQLHNELEEAVAMETTSPPPGSVTPECINPRINVGRSFQAQIPPLQRIKDPNFNSHNALLLWTPIEELDEPANERRVEALFKMASSSVMPGGGASAESALHVLSECRGDFLLTVEMLLSTPETFKNRSTQKHPRVGWSASEKRLLLKSLQLHHKDFRKIQKTVQTKSLSQCVEFYYLWKKKLNLSSRTPAGLTVTLPDLNVLQRLRQHLCGSPALPLTPQVLLSLD